MIAFDMAYFIRLGEGNEWAEECFEQGILKLSFRDVPHQVCTTGCWNDIYDIYDARTNVITHFINQLKHFYNTQEQQLWFTFKNSKMYWCVAGKTITPLPDGRRQRNTINGWSDKDIDGNLLHQYAMSSYLSKKNACRHTISALNETELKYLRYVVNNDKPEEIQKLEQSREQYKAALGQALFLLDATCMELLADLLFTRMGYQRLTQVGKNLPFYDFVCQRPLEDELVGVSVKSDLKPSEYKKFMTESERRDGMASYLVYHTSSVPHLDESHPYLIGPHKLLDLVLAHGLSEWVLNRLILPKGSDDLLPPVMA